MRQFDQRQRMRLLLALAAVLLGVLAAALSGRVPSVLGQQQHHPAARPKHQVSIALIGRDVAQSDITAPG